MFDDMEENFSILFRVKDEKIMRDEKIILSGEKLPISSPNENTSYFKHSLCPT